MFLAEKIELHCGRNVVMLHFAEKAIFACFAFCRLTITCYNGLLHCGRFCEDMWNSVALSEFSDERTVHISSGFIDLLDMLHKCDKS